MVLSSLRFHGLRSFNIYNNSRRFFRVLYVMVLSSLRFHGLRSFNIYSNSCRILRVYRFIGFKVSRFQVVQHLQQLLQDLKRLQVMVFRGLSFHGLRSFNIYDSSKPDMSNSGGQSPKGHKQVTPCRQLEAKTLKETNTSKHAEHCTP